MIAMSLSCNPDLVIADEPTTALDVTIQAQILNLFEELQTKRNMSLLYITHDLGVVANIADRIYVMYAGIIAEQGRATDIFHNARHPYTMGHIPWGSWHPCPVVPSGERSCTASLEPCQTQPINRAVVPSIRGVIMSWTPAEPNSQRCVIMERDTWPAVPYSTNHENTKRRKHETNRNYENFGKPTLEIRRVVN
jgi:ABC-type sulfate/molybdate transport systems ATPase subunit